MLDLTNDILNISGAKFKVKQLKHKLKNSTDELDGKDELLEEILELEKELSKIKELLDI